MIKKLAALPKQYYGIIFTALIAIYFCQFYHHIHQYPFYVAWDMDLTTVIDILLVNAQQMPAHLAHPSFGMSLLLHFSSMIGLLTHHVTAVDINQLQHALNPLLLVAQLTDYLRSTNALITIAIPLCLSISLKRLFDLSHGLTLLLFLLLVNLQVYYTQLAIMRSEFYALFFWSVACYVATTVASANFAWQKVTLLFMTGLLMGLCFLTKVQSIAYFASVPLVLLLSLKLNNALSHFHLQNKANKPWLILSVINLIGFTTLTILAVHISTATIHASVASFRDSFAYTPIWWLSLVVLFTPFLLYAFARAIFLQFAPIVIGLTSGFLLCFLLPILLFNGQFNLAAKYAVFIFKIALMGQLSTWITHGVGLQHTADLTRLLSNFSLIGYLYFFNMVIWLILALSWFHTKKNAESIGYSLLLLLLTILQLLFGVRYEALDLGREVIWLTLLPVLLLMIQCNLLYRQHVLTSLTRFFISSMVVILLLINFHDFYYTAIIQLSRHQFLHAPYRRTQLPYERLMDNTYPRGQRHYILAAMQQAEQYQTIDNRLKGILQVVPPLSLANVGIVKKHALFALRPRQRIVHYSQDLDQAMILQLHDQLSLAERATLAFNLESFNSHIQYIYPANKALVQRMGTKFRMQRVITRDSTGKLHTYKFAVLTLAGKIYLLKHAELLRNATLILKPYYQVAHSDDTNFKRPGNVWGN